MSPRAAWRLEAGGFTAYDYVAGKSDWLAADLPFDGQAQLVGRFTRRDVPVVDSAATVGDALDALDSFGFGPVLVVNAANVVMGALHREDIEVAGRDAPVATTLRFGISTVRPSEQVVELLHRMQHMDLTRVVVTRSDGTLVGLFFAADAHQH